MILLSSRDKCDGPVVATKLQRRAHGTSYTCGVRMGTCWGVPCSLFSAVAKTASRTSTERGKYEIHLDHLTQVVCKCESYSFIVYRRDSHGLALLYSYTLSSGDPIDL